MQIKGIENLARHVPELNSPRGKFIFAAKFFGIFALSAFYFILTDPIPTWTLDSQIVVISIGYLILSRFFTQKNLYIKKYKELAYAKAIEHFAIPGLAIVFAAAIHISYMNGPKFSQPLITTILTWFGWMCIFIGIPLFIRAVSAFGIDNIAMLYVYFPRGDMVNSSIYSIIRHPVYGAMLRICIGLACLNRGIYPLTFVVILPLLVFGWLRLVEEKELIERIPAYAEYRKNVPAFFPYPNRIIDFLKFLVTENDMFEKRPNSLLKFFFKAPLFMHKLGLGGWERLIGAQWMLIITIGRKTGKRRETLVDVMDYDAITDTYFIEAAYGTHADWYKNIQAHPVFEAQVGRRKFKASAQELNSQGTGEILVQFFRKKPAYTRSVMTMVGLKFKDENELRALGNKLTLLAVTPLSLDHSSK